MEYVCDVSLWANLLADNGYELLGQIDSGSFSDVFAVSSVSRNKVMAVKRMVARREIMADPRILAEISCLTQLSNRGACVIGLEDTIVRLDRLVCLVLELAPLGNLERYALEHWPLTPKLLTSACRQLLSALTHCHRLHIAHRDLNPANVLIMSAHSVRLADFGLAFHCRDPASGRRLACEDYLGRESYLAPEVLLHSPYDAVQADMWSMGCLCVFMLTGKHPLTAKPSSGCVCLSGGPPKPRKGQPTNRTSHLFTRPSYSGKGLQPFTATAARRRCRISSCDSEGSGRSESDVEEPLSPVSNLTCHGVSAWGEDLGDADFSPCGCEEDPVGLWAPTAAVNVFKDHSAAKCALRDVASRLCLVNPCLRLTSENALQLWKQSL